MELDSKNRLLLYYQCVLAVVAVFYFFTKLDVYLYQIERTPNPLLFIKAFLVAAIPLYFSLFTRRKYIPYPIVIWCVGYFSVSLFSILTVVQTDFAIQDLETRILTIIFLLLMLLIFSKYPIVQLLARYAILIAAFISVFNIIYELLNPLAFGTINTVIGGDERPAGFYIDPNEAGCGLILSMILSVDLLKPKYRFPFALMVGFGVLLTFSRGAIFSWFVTVITFIITGIISRHQISYWILVTATILILLSSQLEKLPTLKAPDGSILLNENMLDRIAWIENPLSNKNHTDTSRLSLAESSWQKFANQPFLGSGIGSSRMEEVDSSESEPGWGKQPHNMYLVFMIEHGFLGFLFLPTLLWAAIWNVRGKIKQIGISLATFLLIWGIFSHTILSDRYTLLAVALMASISLQSQFHQKY